MSRFCYACLSEDRELKPVDNFDQVKTTLLEWFDNNNSFQVNVDHFQLCWECYAMVAKLSKFKQQVFKAHQLRVKMQKKKLAHLVSQTNLCVYTKEIYDAEYIFEDGESEETDEEKNKTSKRKKKRRSHTSKTKRHKAPDPEPDPIQHFSKIVNTYNYYNNPNIPDVKETSYVSDAKETERVKEVIDLTKDPPKLSMPVELIDKEVKQELIDAYEAEAEKNSSTPVKDIYEENKPNAIDMDEAIAERHGDDNDGEINSHVETGVDDLIEILPCNPCKGSFEGKAAYRAHMLCMHKELAQYAYCGPCDLQFESLEKFKRHVTVHSLFDQLKFHRASGSSKDFLVSDLTCALCKKEPANKIASLNLRGPRFNVNGNLCSRCLCKLQLQGPPQGCDEMHLKVHMNPKC